MCLIIGLHRAFTVVVTEIVRYGNGNHVLYGTTIQIQERKKERRISRRKRQEIPFPPPSQIDHQQFKQPLQITHTTSTPKPLPKHQHSVSPPFFPSQYILPNIPIHRFVMLFIHPCIRISIFSLPELFSPMHSPLSTNFPSKFPFQVLNIRRTTRAIY